MTNSIIFERVNNDEVMIKLLEFYSHLEKILSTRLPHNVWYNFDKKEGAKIALDSWLRTIVREDLQKILPSVGIEWDDQVSIPPLYSNSRIALVDLVDGAKEYIRSGADVTSHIGIYAGLGTELFELQVGIVSYPFHRFRVITLGDGKDAPVYCIPFEFDIMAGDIISRLESGKLKTPNPKTEEKLNIVDRYKSYSEDDIVRRNLDKLREKVIHGGGSYVVSRGSIAKTIVDVTLNSSDVAIRKKSNSPPSDYLTPSKILENNGGIFVDLDGKKPDGKHPIPGFIAASNPETYETFKNALSI